MKSSNLIFIFCFLLLSCSRETIEIHVINNSSSEISNVKVSAFDKDLMVESIRSKEDYKFEKLPFAINRWDFEFVRSNGKKEEMGCTDVNPSKTCRKLKIVVTDKEINIDYDGECY